MAGFLDFAQNIADYIPGGTAAIPSWLTALFTKKPDTSANLNAIAPLYAQIASQGARANQFADEQAQFYNANYRPAAVAFNERAQGIGSPQDLRAAADRSGANFRTAFNTRKAAIGRDMAGVNPNSGAAMARKSALDASFAPGLIHSMNAGRVAREQYGDNMRAQALPFLATAPNFGAGANMSGAAASGMAGLAGAQNALYRQQVADTVKTFKLPFDAEDERQRKAQENKRYEDVVKLITQRFPSGGSVYEGRDELGN